MKKTWFFVFLAALLFLAGLSSEAFSQGESGTGDVGGPPTGPAPTDLGSAPDILAEEGDTVGKGEGQKEPGQVSDSPVGRSRRETAGKYEGHEEGGTMGDTSRIEGKVLDIDGIPVPNAPLTVRPVVGNAMGPVIQKTLTGGAGEYVITDLPPGDYILAVDPAIGASENETKGGEVRVAIEEGNALAVVEVNWTVDVERLGNVVEGAANIGSVIDSFFPSTNLPGDTIAAGQQAQNAAIPRSVIVEGSLPPPPPPPTVQPSVLSPSQ